MTDYVDRFLASTYADDEPVCFSVFTHDRADCLTVSVPESLFARAQAIAVGYKLHLLPAIELYGETSLNKQQCVVLLEEVMFIGNLLNDKLLSHHLLQIADALEKCVNSPGPASFMVEGP